MLYNAAELRIFDVLARQDTPMSADDIARCLSVPQKSVHQLDCLLNICSNLGLLVKRQANDGQSKWTFRINNYRESITSNKQPELSGVCHVSDGW